MRKTLLIAGLLFSLPLCAQNPPAQENPPAQAPETQTPPQAQPKLEAPQMAEPEPEPEKKPALPPVPKPAAKTAAAPAKKPAPGGESRVVEEIVARVNNEIITSSELEKAKASAADEVQQDCNGRCSQDQLRTSVE